MSLAEAGTVRFISPPAYITGQTAPKLLVIIVAAAPAAKYEYCYALPGPVLLAVAEISRSLVGRLVQPLYDSETAGLNNEDYFQQQQ